MNIRRFTPLFIISFIGCSFAFANPQLAKSNDCFTCHSIDKKIIGPSFKDIAAKYKKEIGAVQTLSESIKQGSVGTWGTTPMQAFPDISDSDLKTLSTWILKQE